MTPPTLPPEIEAAIADAGQALVDAWDSAQDGPPHRFVVFVDPEGDPEVAAGWMAMARMHAAAIAAAREAGRREALEGARGWRPAPAAARRKKPANKRTGCKPHDDVCLAHDLPLVCGHGCEEAAPHACKEQR